MTDKPILFSAPMVQALIAGQKTQTRRALRIRGYPGFFQFGKSDTKGYDWTFRRADHVWEDFTHEELLRRMPNRVGDRLYVREHWKCGPAYDDLPPRDLGGEECILYLADNTEQKWGWDHPQVYGRHRQAMHMPRWASRITLTVTDARIERLQDIAESDAKAEGAMWMPPRMDKFGAKTCSLEDCSFRNGFRDVWDLINGPDAWSANPWVCAYTFTVDQRNIDQ